MLPEPVLTTIPALAPARTVEVVINSLSRKFLELDTLPVRLPSSFWRQFFRTGISSLKTVDDLDKPLGDFFGEVSAIDIVPRLLTALALEDLGVGGGDDVGLLRKEKMSFFGGGGGGGGGVGLLRKENRPFFGGGGGGGGGVGLLKKENSPFGGGGGGVGSGAGVGATKSVKSENISDKSVFSVSSLFFISSAGFLDEAALVSFSLAAGFSVASFFSFSTVLVDSGTILAES